jgi:hypothetical protein
MEEQEKNAAAGFNGVRSFADRRGEKETARDAKHPI